MDLKITQKKVLKVLGDNEGKYLSINKIKQLSGVNIGHVKQAIFFFMDNDLVFIDMDNDEATISPDGMEVYNSLDL